MQLGKKVESILNNNDNSIQRRINMMGQELANVGINDVEVEVTVKIKGSDSGGNFQKVRTGKFGKYVKGKGPGKIGGTDDNVKAADATGTADTKQVGLPSVFGNSDGNSISPALDLDDD